MKNRATVAVVVLQCRETTFRRHPARIDKHTWSLAWVVVEETPVADAAANVPASRC